MHKVIPSLYKVIPWMYAFISIVYCIPSIMNTSDTNAGTKPFPWTVWLWNLSEISLTLLISWAIYKATKLPEVQVDQKIWRSFWKDHCYSKDLESTIPGDYFNGLCWLPGFMTRSISLRPHQRSCAGNGHRLGIPRANPTAKEVKVKA